MKTVEKIVNLIEKKEVQYKVFAQELGLPKNVVSEWKNGRLKPSAEHIVKIADYFGVTTDYLLRDSEQIFNIVKSEGNEMEEKRFWDNPLSLILKALRLEQGLTIEQLEKELHLSNYCGTFESSTSDDDCLKTKPGASNIFEYYKFKLDLKKEKATEGFLRESDGRYSFHIFKEKKYPEKCDFSPSDELLDLQTKFARENNINFDEVSNVLAQRIKCLEEISISSFLSGERKLLNDLYERKVYAALGHLELFDKISSD